MKVAFLGLGIMGSRMARNLLKTDKVELSIYNRSTAPLVELEAAGARAAKSWQEAVRGAEVVFTMLSTPEVVEQVAWGEQGFLDAMEKGSLWVDCSTVNPSFSLKAAERACERSLRFIDAPVAGTKPHAENAELVFFVGAEADDLEPIQPLLDRMGRKVIHVGEAGKGASLKMLVNAMLAQSMLIFSETVLLGEKMGLDRAFLLDLLPGLVVAAPFTKAKAGMIRAEDYEVQFPLEWMHKDLHLVAQTAYEQGLPLNSANTAKEVYAAARAAGMGRLDFAAIFKYLENSAGGH